MFRSQSKLAVILIAMGIFLLVGSSVVEACPTCKEGIAQSPDQASLGRGYQASILFMMSMPFLILTGLSSYFYYEIRKARAAQAKAALEEAKAALELPQT